MTKTNNFVKKVLKNKHKIIDIDKIKSIYESIDFQGFNKKQIYKQIYYLKNRGILISLKKDLFYVKSYDEDFDVEDIISQFYRKILKKYLKDNFATNYFIGGIKSLEIWNNNFSIPDKISIINPYKRSNEILLKEKLILNSVYKIKGYDQNKSFKFLKKNFEKFYIDGKMFFVANYELAILESLYSLNIEEERYVIELIKKNIRKNYKKINLEVFEKFLRYGKYGSGVKKLYEISLGIRPDFADKLREILKRLYWF